jgi:hypothetical protein
VAFVADLMRKLLIVMVLLNLMGGDFGSMMENHVAFETPQSLVDG